MILLETHLGIYPRTLWITCDPDVDELNKLFPEGDSNGDRFTEPKETDNATIDSVKNGQTGRGGILIRFNGIDKMRTDTICHESVHAANKVYNYIGASVDTYNDEPYAYLVDFIADQCEKLKLKYINNDKL